MDCFRKCKIQFNQERVSLSQNLCSGSRSPRIEVMKFFSLCSKNTREPISPHRQNWRLPLKSGSQESVRCGPPSRRRGANYYSWFGFSSRLRGVLLTIWHGGPLTPDPSAAASLSFEDLRYPSFRKIIPLSAFSEDMICKDE